MLRDITRAELTILNLKAFAQALEESTCIDNELSF